METSQEECQAICRVAGCFVFTPLLESYVRTLNALFE